MADSGRHGHYCLLSLAVRNVRDIWQEAAASRSRDQREAITVKIELSQVSVSARQLTLTLLVY